MTEENHWEREAQNWLHWARTPGFDSYWYYRAAFFEGMVPSPKGLTLDLACGEGRVTRDLAERGHCVIGVDLSPTLIRAAAAAGKGSGYVNSDASALPFRDETFTLVTAYNCLMDVDDMAPVLRETARVLKMRGHLAACITHPLNEAGEFEDHTADAPFIVRGSYLGDRRPFDAIFRRDDMQMHFRGWAYPLEEYMRRLEEAGFVIERIREPQASDEAIKRFGPTGLRWRRIPLFLMFRAAKLKDARAGD